MDASLDAEGKAYQWLLIVLAERRATLQLVVSIHGQAARRLQVLAAGVHWHAPNVAPIY